MILKEGAGMGRSVYKVEGGKMIKVELTEKDGKIKKIKIMGDFFLHPEDFIEEIENMLIGSPLEQKSLSTSIKAFMDKKKATLLGATPEDIAKCIMMASV